MLKFSPANTKLARLAINPGLSRWVANRRKVYSLDLLSGWSCPGANICKSKVYQLENGKRQLRDGSACQFRCFSASQEVAFPSAYDLRKHNFDLLKGMSYNQIIELLIDSMPKNLGILRFHVAGDFFSKDYFFAACRFAANNPGRLFYAYTKSLPYWIGARQIGIVPDNFIIHASEGGLHDNLIREFNLPFSRVVFHPSETDLPIDHDDSHAADPQFRDTSFALLLHGQQPAGSDASCAIKRMKSENVDFAYSAK